MNKPLKVLTLITAMGLSGTANAVLITPPGLAPGETYQLVFVTSGTTTATSSDISYYNNFAQTAASAAGMGSVVWHAIGSTLSIDANSNAVVSAKVYNMGSELVATGFSDFWDGNHTVGVGIDFDENGMPRNFNVWTGSNTDGTDAGSFALGNERSVWAESTLSSGAWINRGTQYTTVSYSLYALSEPLSAPIPEPETYAMMLAGLSLVGFAARRRVAG